jgi:hypothetical protein
LGIFKQPAGDGGQSFGVVGDLETVAFLQQTDGFGEILRMGTHYDGLGQGHRLDHVGAAHGDQRPTDENHLGEAVKPAQVAHGVAQDHGSVIVGRRLIAIRLDPAVPKKRQALRFDEAGHLVESLRLSGHQDQPHALESRRPRQSAKAAEQQPLLARAGTPRHPEPAACVQTEATGQFVRAGRRFGDDRRIVFQAARHPDAVSGTPRATNRSACTGSWASTRDTRRNMGRTSGPIRRYRGQPFPGPTLPLTTTTGTPSSWATAVKLGQTSPSIKTQSRGRIRRRERRMAKEKSRGKIEDSEPVPIQLAGLGEAGVGGTGEDDFESGQGPDQSFDQRARRVDLAHAHGVQPNARTLAFPRVNVAEALTPTSAISALSEDPIDHPRGDAKQEESVGEIEKDTAHGEQPFTGGRVYSVARRPTRHEAEL